jgi:catechol 2,3-dioxygenase-like lactoylglutathione lyase family enzyme
MAAVRYFVKDVAASTAFYKEVLGFSVIKEMGPPISLLERDGTELWVSGPISSAAQPMPDGRKPESGGWNRIVVEVDDIEAKANEFREKGIVFRNEILSGPGGKQVLIEDPDGNPIEIFEKRK